jgi:hypothetical protein
MQFHPTGLDFFGNRWNAEQSFAGEEPNRRIRTALDPVEQNLEAL